MPWIVAVNCLLDFTVRRNDEVQYNSGYCLLTSSNESSRANCRQMLLLQVQEDSDSAIDWPPYVFHVHPKAERGCVPVDYDEKNIPEFPYRYGMVVGNYITNEQARGFLYGCIEIYNMKRRKTERMIDLLTYGK